MKDWAGQRNAMRAIVHDQFAVPAQYLRAVDSGGTPFTLLGGARVKKDVRQVGGKASDGLLQIIRDIPELRIDPVDLTAAPEQDDLIYLLAPDGSVAETKQVVDVLPKDGIYYVLQVQNV